MHRSTLIRLLQQYRTPFNVEAGYVVRALRFVQQHPNCFDRDLWPGHIASQRGPQHRHYDMRFLVEIDDHLEIPGSHESNAVAWVALADVPRYNNNLSTLRMLEKTRRLKRLAACMRQRRVG